MKSNACFVGGAVAGIGGRRSRPIGRVVLCIAVIVMLGINGCDTLMDADDSTPTGGVNGSATYGNAADHAGIVVTLERLENGRAIPPDEVVLDRRARARALEDQMTTDVDGTFTFDSVPVGRYLIYASSDGSAEGAIRTDVTVEAGRTVSAGELQLTATGAISGSLVNSATGDPERGWIVGVAGTSFLAMTDMEGSFTITGVPAAETEYELVASRGDVQFAGFAATVTPHDTVDVGVLSVQTPQVEDPACLLWRGESASHIDDPELNWAYYNTTDGVSYIWDGDSWEVIARDGADGADGADGTNGSDGVDGADGTNGSDGADGADGISIAWQGSLPTAPASPELNWGYYNTTDGVSYIWDGDSWEVIARDGAAAPAPDANAHLSIGEWVETTPLPSAYSYTYLADATLHGNTIYVTGAGTLDNVVLSATILESGHLSAWTVQANSFATGRGSHGSAAWKNHIYVIGGSTNQVDGLSDVQFAPLLDDGSVGEWTATTSLPATRVSPMVVAFGGYLYVVAGWETWNQIQTQQPSTTTTYYAPINADGTLGSWQTTSNLPTSFGMGICGIINDEVYAAAPGCDSYHAPVLASGTLGPWASTEGLTDTLGLATGSVYRGNMYLVSGTTTGLDYSTTSYSSIVQPDGSLSPWTQATPLPDGFGRYGACSVAYGDRIYVIGGEGESAQNEGSVLFAPLE